MIKTTTLIIGFFSLSTLSFSQENEREEEKDDTLQTNTPVFITTLDDIDGGGSQNVSG